MRWLTSAFVAAYLTSLPYNAQNLKCLYSSCMAAYEQISSQHALASLHIKDIEGLYADGQIDSLTSLSLLAQVYYRDYYLEDRYTVRAESVLFHHDSMQIDAARSLFCDPYLLEAQRALLSHVLDSIVWFFTAVPCSNPYAFILAAALGLFTVCVAYMKNGLSLFILRRWALVAFRSYFYVAALHSSREIAFFSWVWGWGGASHWQLEGWAWVPYYSLLLLVLFTFYISVRLLQLTYANIANRSNSPKYVAELKPHLAVEAAIVLLSMLISAFLFLHWEGFGVATEWGVVLWLGITALVTALLWRLY